MAEDALKKKAAEMNIDIKVWETKRD